MRVSVGLRRIAATSLAVLTLAVGLALAPVASAHASAGPKCKLMHIHLNGNTSTAECLDSKPGSNTITPYNVSKDNSCFGSSLWLYTEANQNNAGGKICFTGAGNILNLGTFSWNDVASSYWTGCSGGTFWSDANLSGRRQDFGAYEKGNFDATFPWDAHLYDNTLTSFTLFNAC